MLLVGGKLQLVVGFVGGQTALTLTLEADTIVLPVIRVALPSAIAFEEHLATLGIDGVDLSGYQAIPRGDLPEELTSSGRSQSVRSTRVTLVLLVGDDSLRGGD